MRTVFSRNFSNIGGEYDLRGKYGAALAEPHHGAHKYDPLKIPKLFTEVTKIEDESQEAALDRIFQEIIDMNNSG